MWIEAICNHSYNRLSLEDEVGISRSYTGIDNYITIHFIHPNLSGINLVDTNYLTRSEAPDDRKVYRSYAPGPGARYWAHHFSNELVNAGETVHIRTGTKSKDLTNVNDISVSSYSQFGWNVKAVPFRVRLNNEDRTYTP